MSCDAVKEGELPDVKNADLSLLPPTEESLPYRGIAKSSGSTLVAAKFCMRKKLSPTQSTMAPYL